MDITQRLPRRSEHGTLPVAEFAVADLTVQGLSTAQQSALGVEMPAEMNQGRAHPAFVGAGQVNAVQPARAAMEHANRSGSNPRH